MLEAVSTLVLVFFIGRRGISAVLDCSYLFHCCVVIDIWRSGGERNLDLSLIGVKKGLQAGVNLCIMYLFIGRDVLAFTCFLLGIGQCFLLELKTNLPELWFVFTVEHAVHGSLLVSCFLTPKEGQLP